MSIFKQVLRQLKNPEQGDDKSSGDNHVFFQFFRPKIHQDTTYCCYHRLYLHARFLL